MKLMLIRDSFSSVSTDGILFADGFALCNTQIGRAHV